MALPTLEYFLTELFEADSHTVSVRGFAAIEAALDDLITEALPVGDSFESDRVTAALKIDLVVALGLFPVDCAGAVRRLARIRNTFAHQFGADFDAKAQKDLLNSVSVAQRDSIADLHLDTGPADNALRWVTFTVFAQLLGALHRRREEQLQNEVWQELLHEAAEDIRRRGREIDQETSATDAKARERLAMKRRERGWHPHGDDSEQL